MLEQVNKATEGHGSVLFSSHKRYHPPADNTETLAQETTPQALEIELSKLEKAWS